MSITPSRTREGDTMSADARSITGELREYARNPFYCVTWHSTNNVLSIADRIDARFDRELQAKQDEIADLQARLDASILPPVDIDGKAWTCDDVDKSFSLTDGDKATEGTIREIAYAWPRDGWFIVDQYDTHYPAEKCHHVAPEPPETIEDVRNIVKSAECLTNLFFHADGEGISAAELVDRAYACGRRDWAGEGR